MTNSSIPWTPRREDSLKATLLFHSCFNLSFRMTYSLKFGKPLLTHSMQVHLIHPGIRKGTLRITTTMAVSPRMALQWLCISSRASLLGKISRAPFLNHSSLLLSGLRWGMLRPNRLSHPFLRESETSYGMTHRRRVRRFLSLSHLRRLSHLPEPVRRRLGLQPLLRVRTTLPPVIRSAAQVLRSSSLHVSCLGCSHQHAAH